MIPNSVLESIGESDWIGVGEKGFCTNMVLVQWIWYQNVQSSVQHGFGGVIVYCMEGH